MITVSRNANGLLELTAKLVAPVIYLDHWALVEFSNKDDYRKKFISALKGKSGTLLLSQANFFESAGFQDNDQALRIESLLNEAIPNVYVADFLKDPGFMFIDGGPQSEESPEKHWLARHMLNAAAKNHDKLTFSAMFTEVVAQSSKFAPIFQDMKAGVAEAVASFRVGPSQLNNGKNFTPREGMSAQHLLMAALLRDTQINVAQNFLENDSMDLIHAVPAAIKSDFVLLDRSWCRRLDRAEKYIADHGVQKKFAKRYWGSPQKIDEFFVDLSSYKRSAVL
jgi:hypothetical protein